MDLEKMCDEIKKGIFSIPLNGRERADSVLEYEILVRITDFIDTIEVKEVDFEKEIDKFIDSKEVWEIQEAPITTIRDTAKYFFELELNAQKGE